MPCRHGPVAGNRRPRWLRSRRGYGSSHHAASRVTRLQKSDINAGSRRGASSRHRGYPARNTSPDMVASLARISLPPASNTTSVMRVRSLRVEGPRLGDRARKLRPPWGRTVGQGRDGSQTALAPRGMSLRLQPMSSSNRSSVSGALVATDWCWKKPRVRRGGSTRGWGRVGRRSRRSAGGRHSDPGRLE